MDKRLASPNTLPTLPDEARPACALALARRRLQGYRFRQPIHVECRVVAPELPPLLAAIALAAYRQARPEDESAPALSLRL